jgi:DNA-directed RNA polymerase specialized sigma subunit
MDFKGGKYLADINIVYGDDVCEPISMDTSFMDIATAVQNDCIEKLNKEDADVMVKNIIDACCQSQLERDVVVGMYGIGGAELTEEEIADKYGIRHEQVDYLKRKLLNRMKLYVRGKGIGGKNRSKFQGYAGSI